MRISSSRASLNNIQSAEVGDFRRRLISGWYLPPLALLLLFAGQPRGNAQQRPQGDLSDRWSAQRANDWYVKQPWLVGADFIPSNAINEFEMFQAATFDPALNDEELGMAESIGMNTVRVFLQDQLWQQDSQGFTQRLDTFLSIAARHHIKPLLVLFDSCWESNPHLGPQHPPIPGIHNSGWVQSPGKVRLQDRSVEPQLEAYVVGIVGAFAKDDRILGWDIWNEPDNKGGDKVEDVAAKVQRVDAAASESIRMGALCTSCSAPDQRSVDRQLGRSCEGKRNHANSAARVRHYHLSQLRMARGVRSAD